MTKIKDLPVSERPREKLLDLATGGRRDFSELKIENGKLKIKNDYPYSSA